MILQVIGERRSVQTDNEATVWRFLGFPYGGQFKSQSNPKGEDFHRTHFSEKTNLGWLEGRDLPVYWDHGMGVLKDEVLGRARYAGRNEDGVLLDVIVQKASEYHDLLKELDELGLLRGSGQAMSSLYGHDEQTGELLKFHVGEYSLTVTPSNNLAAPIRTALTDVLSKYNLRGIMEEEKEKEEVKSLTDEIKSAFKEEEKRTAEEVQAETERALREEIVALRTAVQTLTELVTAQQKDVTEIRSALPLLAKEMGEYVRTSLPKVAAVMGGAEKEIFQRSSAQQPRPAGTSLSGLVSPRGK